ncbi:hypothetical protein ACT3CD_15890 [Geofilum sp. OHC36d9]|uniref:hypothetical protein n=1 Tax=Geofilum sp. OHC36d9 TaxID=3458413 RepID=UPI0040338254
MVNLIEFDVTELSFEESLKKNGGGQVAEDIGYAVGFVVKKFVKFMNSTSELNNPWAAG